MNVRHSQGVLHSFSIKNIFHDKMDLRLFYFHVAKYRYSLNYDKCKSITHVFTFIVV